MRFTSVLSATALLGLALAATVPATKRDGPDVSVDVCAYIDTTIVLDLTIISIDLDVKVCLCLDAVVGYTNSLGIAKFDPAGSARRKMAGDLSNLINNHAGRRQCTYPSNCTPSCQSADVCHWDCKPGYQKSTDAFGNPICVCSTGTYECSGKCIPNNQQCPSAGAHKRHVTKPMKPHCPQGSTVCGVYLRGLESWDCVDTMNDLESCGGCTIPFSSSSIPGVDCTTIPHVSDVACVRGTCQVFKCRRGYVVGSDGSSCIDPRASPAPQLQINNYYGHPRMNSENLSTELEDLMGRAAVSESITDLDISF